MKIIHENFKILSFYNNAEENKENHDGICSSTVFSKKCLLNIKNCTIFSCIFIEIQFSGINNQFYQFVKWMTHFNLRLEHR